MVIKLWLEINWNIFVKMLHYAELKPYVFDMVQMFPPQCLSTLAKVKSFLLHNRL
jgi:hypothetical protein